MHVAIILANNNNIQHVICYMKDIGRQKWVKEHMVMGGGNVEGRKEGNRMDNDRIRQQGKG